MKDRYLGGSENIICVHALLDNKAMNVQGSLTLKDSTNTHRQLIERSVGA